MQPVAEHIDYKVLYQQAQEENGRLRGTNASLTHQLEQFKKMIFGSKSERFVAVDDKAANLQLRLDLDAETIAQCKITDAKKITVIRTKTEVTQNKPKVHP